MTIHDFDMARYLMGDIVAVQAIGAHLVDPAIEAAGDIDAAMITLIAQERGDLPDQQQPARGLRLRPAGRGVRRARACSRSATSAPTTVAFWGAAATEAQDPVLNFFIERYTPAYNAEISHFVDCVEQGRTPLVGYRDGREALRLADAALESMQTGRLVRLA